MTMLDGELLLASQNGRTLPFHIRTVTAAQNKIEKYILFL